MIRLHTGGRFYINFENEDDHKIFKKERNVIRNLVISLFIATLLWALDTLLVFSGKSVYLLIWFIIALIFIIIAKTLETVLGRYQKYKFDCVIEEIKKNKWRLKDSNNRTGHISYVKDGVGHSIYVFKGKNAKSSR